MWGWIKARSSERSTWTGIGLFLGLLGVPAANEIAANIGTIAGAAVAVVGILAPTSAGN